MSNLTKEKAAKVLAGGGKIWTGNVLNADAQKNYIANQILSKGGKEWTGELRTADQDKSLYANKALSKGMMLGSGTERNVAPELAARVVEKAEKEAALQQAILKQMAGMEK